MKKDPFAADEFENVSDATLRERGASLEDRFEHAVIRDDPFELQDLILEIAIDSEARLFAEHCCVQLTKHRNAEVQGNSLRGFGHLARRFGILDPNRIRPLIQNGLYARSEAVRREAESAADDTETFLSWRFDRP
jgi:hypothetical protein